VATYLNVFVRKSAVLRMANLAQLVNVIAPIVTSPDGLFLQSIFHPVRLISTATQEVALDTFVDSGTHAHADRAGERWPYRVADLGPFQLLDVAATRDAEGRQLTISVVNRDPGQTLDTRIHLSGARVAGPVVVHEVTGDSPEVSNSAAEPDVVTTVSTKRDVGGGDLDLRFPPHSFTLLEVQLV
jgi:alpha-N-arabinofuranosidase